MSLRDICVITDDTETGEARVRLAAKLAQPSRAHLIGVCARATFAPLVADVNPIAGASGAIIEMRDRAREISAERAARAEAMLHDVARVHGLTDEWHDILDEDPLDRLIGAARCADLILLGQFDPERREAAAMRELAELLLLESGRPVLFVPYIGTATAIPPKRALICWNDSRPAARAVNDAVPLLADAEVTVLAIDAGPTALERAGAEAIAAHLVRHGVRATPQQTISNGIPAADVILNYASDLGAHMIVMGGYGHSRRREHLLGGVTFELLRTMTVPVLMSH